MTCGSLLTLEPRLTSISLRSWGTRCSYKLTKDEINPKIITQIKSKNSCTSTNVATDYHISLKFNKENKMEDFLLFFVSFPSFNPFTITNIILHADLVILLILLLRLLWVLSVSFAIITSVNSVLKNRKSYHKEQFFKIKNGKFLLFFVNTTTGLMPSFPFKVYSFQHYD